MFHLTNKKPGMSTRLAFICSCVIFFCIGATVSAAESEPVRVSAWYWLNSAPKADWEGDFVTMKHLGFTDVVLAWGLDVSGVVTRKIETRQAMQWVQKAGLGAYIIVWQPEANSLSREPEFMQVDTKGRPLLTFDTFNPKWRSTQWKDYLQEVVKTYAQEPAFVGYVFDDSFGSANVSYGSFEEKTFGGPLPRKPEDPRWDEWTKARQGWWEDWAVDTVQAIRAVDPDKRHIIYLEDTIGRITEPRQQANIGLDFARVARHFDAVGGYTMPVWTTNADSQEKVAQLTRHAIESVRQMIGPDKPIIYTFWSANIAEERKHGPAAHPTAAEIQQICEQALKLGVRRLDMYGFRIGEYNVTREQMARMMPAEPASYILTGQFPQKFMWDRPGIQADLGAYLRGLTQR